MKVKQIDGREAEINTLWDFLEEYMTDYTRDGRILRLNDLAKFMDNEMTSEDLREYGFIDVSFEEAHEEEMELTEECFMEAFKNCHKRLISEGKSEE